MGYCAVMWPCPESWRPHRQPLYLTPTSLKCQKNDMDRETSIACALEDYREGRFKFLRQAAIIRKIPARTLTYRANGRQSYQEAHANGQACTPAEEKALTAWVAEWAAQNFPIRMDMFKSMAKYLIYQRLRQACRDTISFCELSHAWPGRFIQRHQYL